MIGFGFDLFKVAILGGGDTTPGGALSALLLSGDMNDDNADGLTLEGDMATGVLLLEGDMA